MFFVCRFKSDYTYLGFCLTREGTLFNVFLVVFVVLLRSFLHGIWCFYSKGMHFLPVFSCSPEVFDFWVYFLRLLCFLEWLKFVSWRLTTFWGVLFPLDLLAVRFADTAQYCTVLVLVLDCCNCLGQNTLAQDWRLLALMVGALFESGPGIYAQWYFLLFSSVTSWHFPIVIQIRPPEALRSFVKSNPITGLDRP
jgi:hypothetical protein